MDTDFHPSQYTIGLVWEDHNIAEITKMMLEMKGYKIVEYHTPENTLTKLNKEVPDMVLLCNMMMPKLSGEDLIRTIRQYYSSNDVEIVAMSVRGYGWESIMNMIGDYISKPFDADELVGTVKRVLRCRDIRRASQKRDVV